MFRNIVLAITAMLFLCQGCDQTSPEVPRIDFVEMSAIQDQKNDPDIIWYDDFDEEMEYLESEGNIDRKMFFGLEGGSM